MFHSLEWSDENSLFEMAHKFPRLDATPASPQALLASKFYSLMGTFARGLFNLSSTPKDSCKNLAQILLTNGTFASGLFNLGASNGLLKTFGSSLLGLRVVFTLLGLVICH